VDNVAGELALGTVSVDPKKGPLVETRRAVVEGWKALANLLERQGHRDLAQMVARFPAEMPPANTDKERIADQLRSLVRGRKVERPQATR
jgi:hypothetical protein